MRDRKYMWNVKNDGAAGRPDRPVQAQARDRKPAKESQAEDGPTRLFGIHAAEAALRNPARTLISVQLTENAEHRLADAIKARGQKIQRVQPRDLDRLLGADAVHQGVLLEVEPLAEPTLDDLAERASIDNAGPLIALDQVTDPHNVGAILRSAAAFGATGLIMTRRHSPPLSGALAKAASGALEHVPVSLVPNLAQALGKLGDLAILRIGLDGEATAAIESEPMPGGVALVLGAEGKGLRRLTRELCDRLCRITTTGNLASLNVSNAAAIALHAIALRHASKA